MEERDGVSKTDSKEGKLEGLQNKFSISFDLPVAMNMKSKIPDQVFPDQESIFSTPGPNWTQGQPPEVRRQHEGLTLRKL